MGAVLGWVLGGEVEGYALLGHGGARGSYGRVVSCGANTSRFGISMRVFSWSSKGPAKVVRSVLVSLGRDLYMKLSGCHDCWNSVGKRGDRWSYSPLRLQRVMSSKSAPIGSFLATGSVITCWPAI